jgi:phage-related minor tail protein
VPNEIDIFVKGNGSQEIGKFGTEAKKAGKEIGDGLKKGFQDGEQAADKAAKGLKGSFGEAFDVVSDLAGEAGGGVGDALSSGIGAAKGGLLAAGVAVGSFVIEGIQSEMEEDKVGGMIAAQTGAASSAAEGLGNTAGEVFADNFGDSIEDVGAAMSSIFENKLIDTSAPQAEVEQLTEKVITLSKVMGEDFDAVGQAASRMVKNNIAGSVSDALDLIGEAQEKGLNASGDLLDTITEYSTKFRDLGLNGQQALGLISQMMDNGARNTDVAADALKEFQLQASQLSGTARRGFETLGLDADEMSKKVATGGASARQALDQVLDGLRAMPPGVERSTTAVDLFGTKAEDLGQALYKLDLDKAAKEFEHFGGTVDDMAKKIGDQTSFWEKLGKGISNAAGALGDFLDTDFSEMLGDMPEVKNAMDDLNKAKQDFDKTGSTKSLDEMKRKFPEVADQIDAYIKKQREAKDTTDEGTGSNDAYFQSLQQIIEATTNMAGGYLDLSDAQIGYNQSLSDATDAMKQFQGEGLTPARDGFNLATEAGRQMQGSLNDVAQGALDVMSAMQEQGATTQEVQGFVQNARDQFVSLATQMGLGAGAANALADKLGLIPGNYAARVAVDGLDAAIAKLNGFSRLLASIQRTVYVNVNAAISQTVAAVTGHAHGGITGAEAWWGAQSGGTRHGSTLVDEAGPEVISLPDGSKVATAGATRALAEMGAFSGGGGPVQVNVSLAADPGADAGAGQWLQSLVRKGVLKLKVDSSNRVVVG